MGVVWIGCSQPSHPIIEPDAAVANPRPQNVVVRHTAPVPGGRKIPCEHFLDSERVGKTLGKEVVILEKPTKKYTASCAVHLAGTPPSHARQQRMLKSKRRLGVLPGDEFCAVHLSCWYPKPEKRRFEDKCVRDGRRDRSLGVLACVRATQKGAHQSYTYEVIDPESGCTLTVRAGPSLNQEAGVKACTKAALELVTADTIVAPTREESLELEDTQP